MRIAALDLGSNSFHLLVVEAHPDGHFDILVKDKEMLRLGDVVSRTGVVPDEHADAAVAAVRRFRMLAHSVQADEVVATATSALRDAENSVALLDRMEQETGVRVEVISGLQEARLIFEAVRASVLLDPGPGLALDLGGGSLELMVGDANGLRWADSVPLGVARLTAECVRNDPLEPADVRRLTQRVHEQLDRLAPEIEPLRPQVLVGSSGTLVDLARMAAARRSGAVPPTVNQLSVRAADLRAVHEDLLALPAAERARLSGLDPRRADQIPAGSVVLQAVLERFGFAWFTVSEWALREGMVLDAIGHHDAMDWGDDPRALRRASVLGLCQRFAWNEPHGRQVARLSCELFDATWPLHRLGPHDRELLEAAGLLHDIGEYVGTDGHHRHGAYLVVNGRLRGFSPEEVDMLATLVRFHRRGDAKASFEPYARLGRDDRARVGSLLALLCLADGLDRSHAQVVDGLRVRIGPEVVTLVLEAAGNVDLEVWGVKRKRAAFESAFGRSLAVAVDGPTRPGAAPLAGVSARPDGADPT